MALFTLEQTRDALADEWKRRDPIGDDGIAAFYRESECLADDLEAWHQTAERQRWTAEIAAIAERNRVRSVLDVGAGGGHDLRALRGIAERLAAVEPNDRLRGNLVDDGFAAVEDIAHVEGTFDLVVCIDVLEHVPDPEALLAAIAARVKPGGLLIEASATHDQSTPLHLPDLAGWLPDHALERAGFVAVDMCDRMAVWQCGEVEAPPASLLVVAHREVSCPTVECLFEMVGRGWPIALVYGDALVDRARAKAVSAWYQNDDTDVFLMVDDDIVFMAADAERVVELAREKRSIACGAYPVGGGTHLASRGWPGQLHHFGPDQEPRQIRWPATGFMAVHRDVVTALIESLGEPCYPGAPDQFWPMFTPFKHGPDYLSEDYAFGQRALDLGFVTWLDPKAILVHLKLKPLSVLNMDGALKDPGDVLGLLDAASGNEKESQK